VSDEPIEIHSFIYNPDIVVVVDRSMATLKSTASGLAKAGAFVCNFEGSPLELRQSLNLADTVKVYSVDATAVALKSLGRDIPNTPMLGALVHATGIVSISSMEKVLGERFKGGLQASNSESLRLGFEGVKSG
jgi:pyruvate ferredoxin oxidoreductase gamma subunit